MLRAMLTAALLAAVLFTLPRAAHADDIAVDLDITSVSATRLDLGNPEQVITITGTLTNVSTTPLPGARVHFWRLPTPISSPERLASVEADPPLGERLYLDPTNVADPPGPLQPGERFAFTVQATVEQLTTQGTPLVETDVAYLIGAQVRAGAESGRLSVALATAPVAATTTPVTSSAVVVLSATPSRLSDGSFPDDSLTATLNDRLRRLLTSAERDGMEAAIDPALYEAAVAMTEEHLVAGAVAPASGIALGFVQAVDALAREGRLWRLPYGNPDLARADASGKLDDVLRWSEAAMPIGLMSLPTLAIVDDPGLVAALPDVDRVLVPGGTGSRPGTVEVLGATPPGDAAPLGLRLSRLIVDELLADEPPLYLIESVADAEADEDLGDTRARVAPVAGPTASLVWPKTAEVAPWRELTAALDSAIQAGRLLDDLTASTTGDALLAPVGASAFSADFSSERAAVGFVAAGTPQGLDLSKVTFRAAPSFVMGSRTNTFPATVSNGLDVPITVQVDFASDSPQRINVPDLPAVTVEAGASVTLDVVPSARANGVARVLAQITTTGGIPVGEPAIIEITATDFGRVGWMIILVSGAVVLGGTALRIRAVRHEKERASVREADERRQ